MIRITDRIVDPALRRTCSVRPDSMPAPIHWNQRDWLSGVTSSPAPP